MDANRIVAFRTSAVRHNLRGAAAPFIEEPDVMGGATGGRSVVVRFTPITGED
ncbi:MULTISPECIES: hypothetical protein [unclassified Bradyrhizobium]|uniref:hypothetical protein n=1 Tax=unclassified Bradyrhizobium TaxID=2631580 RepID=UPI0018886EA6|nr:MULTISPECIES: hypothetical protein [unclassified Bradyrhizobium]WFU71174.1 hypothetical protein QA642_38965 [Bradyrhizobium sp. CB2312]